MNDIPEFAETVQQFRAFLREQGHPTTLVWVFRDDLWKMNLSRVLLREFHGSGRVNLAEKVFVEGRAKGLVQVTAVAQSNDVTAATVWYPKYEDEEIQGWNQGLKLSVVQPLPAATLVSRLLWWPLLAVPGFREYQRTELTIGTKRWAAA